MHSMAQTTIEDWLSADWQFDFNAWQNFLSAGSDANSQRPLIAAQLLLFNSNPSPFCDRIYDLTKNGSIIPKIYQIKIEAQIKDVSSDVEIEDKSRPKFIVLTKSKESVSEPLDPFFITQPSLPLRSAIQLWLHLKNNHLSLVLDDSNHADYDLNENFNKKQLFVKITEIMGMDSARIKEYQEWFDIGIADWIHHFGIAINKIVKRKQIVTKKYQQ
ncbi:hypothetical protein RFI_02094 [Reticulomyxa filosa]|uniref:Uncharacterized protein n=1 Tax=Reticulomyxa filosa TaxID=46433 RepID=X6PA25_RETFI|nr:hypothetical protein RFI_02094 [Reticulomyxa filosa]|eukprot:ETO34983.1 hypothetical protein RFI_02094 [Reticulomyxa filosa]